MQAETGEKVRNKRCVRPWDRRGGWTSNAQQRTADMQSPHHSWSLSEYSSTTTTEQAGACVVVLVMYVCGMVCIYVCVVM